MQENTKTGQDIQIKMEFYLIALAFTIAGYGIQTMALSGSCIIDMLMFIGVALIILSGVFGIYRTSYIPVLFRFEDAVMLVEAKILNNTVSEKDREALPESKNTLEKWNAWFSNSYLWHRGIFIVGLILLYVSKIGALYQG